MRNILRRLCSTIWIGCVLLLTLCVFNYPRIWWQEAISSLALLWVPILLLSIAIAIFRVIRHGASLYRMLLLVVQVACATSVISTVTPYISHNKKENKDLIYAPPISIILVDDSAGAAKSGEALLLPSADIVVIVKATSDQSPRVANEQEISSVVQSTAEGNRTVEIRSRLPFLGTPRRDVGYEALPAVFGTFSVAGGTALEIGAFELLPSFSQESFVASRLTSRRIATLLRFSDTPRMVVGSFRAPITSQIVDMYPDQVRLKSVLFNKGVSGLWRRFREALSWSSALNVFVAKNIILERVVEHEPERDGWRGISFVARVPLAKN